MYGYNKTLTLPYNGTVSFYNSTVNATTRSLLGSGQNDEESVGTEWKIITRFIYIIIFLVGIVGNLLTCYIIISRKFMRRVIHIYTFNLAVSDLAVIFLYIPVEMVRNENDLKWTMGASMCKISYIVTPTSLISSVCTLVAITLDRHRGVTRPFKWRGDSEKLLRYSLPVIWTIAIACSSPLFYYANIVKYRGGLYCVESWTNKVQETVYWLTMFFVMVVVPLLIIIIANAHMIFFMKKLSSSISHCDTEQHKQHRRMIRMVVALVLVYALCSSPQHIVFFWFRFGSLESNKSLSVHIFKASNLMIIVQSAINPIIYGTGRKDFQGAFKNIFQCLKMREWISVSREETRTGAIGALLLSDPSCNKPESTLDVSSDQFNTSSVFRSKSLISQKLERIRRKSEERSVTDTPPLKRFINATHEPENEVHESAICLRTDNLPITMGRIPKKRVSFKNLKEETDDENNRRITYSLEVQLDRNFLSLVASLSESDV